MHIEVIYAGATYTIRNRSIEDVQGQIDTALAAGLPDWLEAIDGYGSIAPARLLIGAGIGIVLVAHETPSVPEKDAEVPPLT